MSYVVNSTSKGNEWHALSRIQLEIYQHIQSAKKKVYFKQNPNNELIVPNNREQNKTLGSSELTVPSNTKNLKIITLIACSSH
jgi:hypothetical protein